MLAGATDFAGQDGLADRSWTVTAVTGGACQDQLQLPPTPISLVRQPPSVANQRPPDNETADWCYDLTFKPTGEVKSFIVYAPPLPLKVGELTLSEDSDHSHARGTYTMGTTIQQTREFTLSETCLTAQGLRLSCPLFGRRLGEFLYTEPNIYNVRCQDPADPAQGGCDCKIDLSFIGGPNGRWALQPNGTQIEFFDNQNFNPPALADYCYNPGDQSLDLTGSNETALFNQKSLRTLHMQKPSCNDGVQSKEIGELGVDCGPGCPDHPTCGNCTDGIANGDELGIDCGGACLNVFCDPDPNITDRTKRHAACANGKQDPWEEGTDCGGPCMKDCP